MSTPNGQKAQIMVEELIEAYGTRISVTLMQVITLRACVVDVLERLDYLTLYLATSSPTNKRKSGF